MHNPVKKEPKDRLRIMVKLVSPLAIDTVRRGLFDQDSAFEREFLDSILVATCITFRTGGYCGDKPDDGKRHCTSLLNSTRDEDGRSLITL